MRERQKLDTALGAVRALENELADATGLIEMAEAEGDAAMVADAENAIAAIIESTDPDRAAKAGIQRMAKASPDKDPLNAAFMNKESVARVTPGNSEDDIAAALADADLIIESVPEIVELKRKVWAEIEKYRKPGSVVASVTSTIRWALDPVDPVRTAGPAA